MAVFVSSSPLSTDKSLPKAKPTATSLNNVLIIFPCYFMFAFVSRIRREMQGTTVSCSQKTLHGRDSPFKANIAEKL